MIYLKLFINFLIIGTLSFGGGYGMISLMREIVLSNHWLSEDMFMSFVAVANADKGFTQEQVDEMIQSAVAELKPFDSDNAGFTVTVKGEGGNVTAVSCSAEDVQSVVDVLQMNAEDGAKAVASVKSDSVLILLHALDTRATVKKAAQKQHDTLFSADGNSNESVGGNATTDSITEGADT